MISAFVPGFMGCLDYGEGLFLGGAEGSEAALSWFDESLRFELVGESPLYHSFQDLGEAREKENLSEVGEGGR